MPKLPAIQFYPGDWLKDPNLSKCSTATRGVWIDAVCAMHESDRSGVLSGTPDQLSRVLRCGPADVTRAARELKATGAADVEESNGVVTLTNRRMQREHLDRVATMHRVRKYRGVTDVKRECNAHSSSSSSSSKDPPAPQRGGEGAGEGEEAAPLFGPAPLKTAKGVPIPQPLWTKEFIETWGTWETHLRQMHVKTTAKADEQQLAKCERWGPAYAARVILHSIGNNWRGLYEPKGPAPNGQAAPRQAPKSVVHDI